MHPPTLGGKVSCASERPTRENALKKLKKPRDHKALVARYRLIWDVKCSCGWARGDYASERAATTAWRTQHTVTPPDTRNPHIQVKR